MTPGRDKPAPLAGAGAPGERLTVTPEIRQQAADHLAGKRADNPIQASLGKACRTTEGRRRRFRRSVAYFPFGAARAWAASHCSNSPVFNNPSTVSPLPSAATSRVIGNSPSQPGSTE